MKRASQAEIELERMRKELSATRGEAYERKEAISIEISTLSVAIEAIEARIDALRQTRQTSSDRQKPKHS